MITCFELGVSYNEMPYEKLEPYEGKLSRTVLRGGIGSNADLLPDRLQGNCRFNRYNTNECAVYGTAQMK